MTEATAFCMRARFALNHEESVYISVKRVFDVATLILVRDGADRDKAQRAIAGRLRSRRSHTGGSNVPSVHMSAPNFEPAPRRKDLAWSERDHKSMRTSALPVNITAYDPVTGVSLGWEDHAESE